MTTARQLCTDAISEVGVIGVGQTPLDEDIDAIFTRLQRMIAVWQKNRWLIPSLQEISITGDGSKFFTVGLGGDFNIIPPSDIKGGYIVQRNTGQTPVSLPLRKIFSYEDYIRISVKDLNSLPTHFFYDNGYPIAKLYAWPVANSTYQLHFLTQSRLGFASSISDGSITNGGAAYTDGNYDTVELTGGSGSGAIADITVTAGVISLVTIPSGTGQGYAIGDQLSVNAADVGGTGAGFIWTVSDITSTLDSQIIMPEEYEEAIMYNLALRAASYYQVTPLADTKALAKAGLNNIRKNNTQVPSLQMPAAPGVRTGKAFNLYNPDGYAAS